MRLTTRQLSLCALLTAAGFFAGYLTMALPILSPFLPSTPWGRGRRC